MKDKDYLRYLEVIEMHMVDLLPDVDPKSLTLYESMKYSFTAGSNLLNRYGLSSEIAYTSGMLRVVPVKTL